MDAEDRHRRLLEGKLRALVRAHLGAPDAELPGLAATGGTGFFSAPLPPAGLRAFAHSARTFSGLSLPSSVVRSTMDMASRSPEAFVEVLMLRLVNCAVRRFTMTASTGRETMVVGDVPTCADQPRARRNRLARLSRYRSCRRVLAESSM